MRRLCGAGIALAIGGTIAAQPPADSTRWQMTLGAGAGVPHGWVQVRENTVDGTRLSLTGDLRVSQVQTVIAGVEYAPSARSRYALTITGYQLDGSAPLSSDVYFNGTTLAGGSTLATRTNFTNFVALSLTGAWRVAPVGAGTLSAGAGLSFVALTFVLHGTLAAGSATRETQEDFVTQELPVPVVGVDLRLPLAPRFELRAAAWGGFLPWVNSLRQEGGTVTISQSEGSLLLGARYDLSARWQLGGAFRYGTLTQREQSTEDGNEITVSATTFAIALAARY